MDKGSDDAVLSQLEQTELRLKQLSEQMGQASKDAAKDDDFDVLAAMRAASADSQRRLQELKEAGEREFGEGAAPLSVPPELAQPALDILDRISDAKQSVYELQNRHSPTSLQSLPSHHYPFSASSVPKGPFPNPVSHVATVPLDLVDNGTGGEACYTGVYPQRLPVSCAFQSLPNVGISPTDTRMCIEEPPLSPADTYSGLTAQDPVLTSQDPVLTSQDPVFTSHQHNSQPAMGMGLGFGGPSGMPALDT
ncbi:hypothetical protein KIPB_003759, partial [Kipferlia bialata]|eukprot:g3759.t1